MDFIRRLASSTLLVGFVGLTACGGADLAAEDELGTEATASSSSAQTAVKIILHGPLTTGTLTPAIGCKSLESSSFIADPFGECGFTMTISDCSWNSDTGHCECTVTISRPC